eukprot:m.266093 g.266093  ORF g.266093 m.266093 type:complete len:404 (+) comp26764_c0_seq1:191-1402(+)
MLTSKPTPKLPASSADATSSEEASGGDTGEDTSEDEAKVDPKRAQWDADMFLLFSGFGKLRLIGSEWLLQNDIPLRSMTNEEMHCALLSLLRPDEDDVEAINDLLAENYDCGKLALKAAGGERTCALMSHIITDTYFTGRVRAEWCEPELIKAARLTVEAILKAVQVKNTASCPIFPPFWFMQIFQVERAIKPADIKRLVYGMDPASSGAHARRATGLAFHLPTWLEHKPNENWRWTSGARPSILRSLNDNYDIKLDCGDMCRLPGDETMRRAGDGPLAYLFDEKHRLVLVNAIRTIPQDSHSGSGNAHHEAWRAYTTAFHTAVLAEKKITQAVMFRAQVVMNRATGTGYADPEILADMEGLVRVRHPSKMDHDDRRDDLPSLPESKALCKAYLKDGAVAPPP